MASEEADRAPAAVAPGTAAERKRKVAKRPVKITVNVHDRTQLETVFDYYLRRGESPSGKRLGGRSLRYQVDAYLFYPRQFALDEGTYPKEKFFADLRPLLRFREPKFGYKLLLGTKGSQGGKASGALPVQAKVSKHSPLVFLDAFVAGLEKGQTSESVQNAIDEVRLFACSYISSFLRGIDRHKRKLGRFTAKGSEMTGGEGQKLAARLRRLVERAQTTVASFRLLLARSAQLSGADALALTTELRLVDEYCYYRLRDGIAFLLVMADTLAGCGATCDGLGAAAAGLREQLQAALRLNEGHAASQSYLQLTPLSSEADKERFLHRRGELKRRIWQVLFVKLRTASLFRVERQLAAMIAAGAASVWALAAQFMLVQRAMQVRFLSDIVGVSGLIFLLLGTVAYIIKDRIKDLGRGYVGAILRHLPDHSEQLFYHSREGKQVSVGSLQETARFYAADALPGAVKALRAQVRAGQANGDVDTGVSRVLHYRKVVSLSRSLRILNRYPLRAVHDILRLNIAACLPRLAEPSRVLDLVTAEGLVEAVRFPKVYYFDMVLGYSQLGSHRAAEEQPLEYFRLVLDKKGLLRVERLT